MTGSVSSRYASWSPRSSSAGSPDTVSVSVSPVIPLRTRTFAPVIRSRIAVLDKALVAGRSQARSAASVRPRSAAVSWIVPPASVIAMLASFLRSSMNRWWARTPLSSHIDVTPLAACIRLSTTVPPLGSVVRSAVALATSATLSGVTSTAARPSASSSASVGTPSLAGSSAMNTTWPGSKLRVKASETSAAVIPGSIPRRSARD